MGDEKIIKMKPLRRDEEIFLMRSCLKDGMTQLQSRKYIKAFKDEVKHNHKENNKTIKKSNKKSFKDEFRKLKKKKLKPLA